MEDMKLYDSKEGKVRQDELIKKENEISQIKQSIEQREIDNAELFENQSNLHITQPKN
jgi:hypothetical protein